MQDGNSGDVAAITGRDSPRSLNCSRSPIMSDASDSKPPVVILATPRLILRAAIEQDVPVMWQRIFGDAEVMRYVFKGKPMAEEQAGQLMRKHFTFGDKRTGLAVLTEKPTGDIIGFSGVMPCHALDNDDFEI